MVSYAAVFVCAVVNMLIHMIWYSPVAFGDLWAEINHFSKNQLAPSPIHYVGAVTVSFVLAWSLAYILARVGPNSIFDGVTLGTILWLGFIVTTLFSGFIWANKPFGIFLIDSLCLWISLVLNSAILTVWTRKTA